MQRTRHVTRACSCCATRVPSSHSRLMILAFTSQLQVTPSLQHTSYHSLPPTPLPPSNTPHVPASYRFHVFVLSDTHPPPPPNPPPPGIDRQMSVWDVRTYRPLHSYLMHRPCTTLDISQRGLLACGFGRCACYSIITSTSCRRCCYRRSVPQQSRGSVEGLSQHEAEGAVPQPPLRRCGRRCSMF